MNAPLLRAIGGSLLLLLVGPLSAQEPQWQVAGPLGAEHRHLIPFVDFDHDGFRDFLRLSRTTQFAPWPYLQVASGKSGDTLYEYTQLPVTWPSGACHAGDVDGDGWPDLAVLHGNSSFRLIDLWSTGQNTVLWSVWGSGPGQFGNAMLGDIDVDGDGHPDFVAVTTHPNESDIYVYDHLGGLRYTLPCLSIGRIAISLSNMGDRDGDGCDDLMVGCNDTSQRGLQWLISGRTGATIRETFGLLPGDRTSAHVSVIGDWDGDGVDDYAAFPYFSASRLIAVAYSGGTGAVIRSWPEYGASVVVGEDFDQDGVNDIVTGADWVVGTNLYGRTYCRSGRDGSELWRVDNEPVVPSSSGSTGGSGWMESCANLGVQPGNPYPVLAWIEPQWIMTGSSRGRMRAFGGARAGQGPVTGAACASSGTLPLIGVRAMPTGSRITVAKTHPNALAALQLAFTALPTPVDLSPFGFSGCAVYLDPAASALALTGTTGIDRGYAAIDLPHPLTAAATGVDAVAQWLVYDPTSLAYAATQLHAVKLQ